MFTKKLEGMFNDVKLSQEREVVRYMGLSILYNVLSFILFSRSGNIASHWEVISRPLTLQWPC